MVATIHALTSKAGYEDILFDFSQCDAAFPAPMIGLTSQVAHLRAMGIDCDLTLPADDRLARLFSNANWAHHIDPANHKPSQYRGYLNVPVSRFATVEEQGKTVNRMIDALLCSISGIERTDLAAIEWSLNEVVDNVLIHSECKEGGFAQLNNYKLKQRVEFCVADAGIGIPTSLRTRFPDLEDNALLEHAVREGVTRDPALGQGNGLFGTFEVAKASSGYIHIISGFATLSYDREHLRITQENIPFAGALVVACMDHSNPSALADALRFRNMPYAPLDYISLHYEDHSTEDIVMRMQEETVSCGSRKAGEPIRHKLKNLIGMNPGHRVIVDMSDIPIVSSSFADEVFGKLFVEIGPLGFMKVLELRGMTPTIQSLIDRAITQRNQS